MAGQDRYAGLHGSRGRGAPRGGFGMGGRGFAPRGSFRGRGGGGGGGGGGGYVGGGGGTGGRGFENVYRDYPEPGQGYNNGGGYAGGYGGPAADLPPSQQIMVRNVSLFFFDAFSQPSPVYCWLIIYRF